MTQEVHLQDLMNHGMQNNNVFNNDFYHGSSSGSITGLEAWSNKGELFNFDTSTETNLFFGNSYCVNNLNGTYWNYGPYDGTRHRTFSYFQSEGQDVGSPITTECTIPDIPEWNYVTGQVQDINNPEQPEPEEEEEDENGGGEQNGNGGGGGNEGTNTIVCGSLDSNDDDQINYIDLGTLESIYKFSCSDSFETYTCGHMDSNKDGMIDIIDFVNFAKRMNSSC